MPVIKPETKPETKPDVKPETMPEVKPEAKPEVVAETISDIKQEADPEVKPDVKPAKANGNGGVASISIKDLLNSAGKNSGKTGPGSQNRIGSDEITPEKLLEVWTKMAQAETSLPRLSTTISQTEPVLKGGSAIQFKVKNELQKNWIELYCKARLVEFLRVNLNNKEVTLNIEVTPDEEVEEKLYMPQQKAEFLKANHPEVKNMMDDLNLELK